MINDVFTLFVYGIEIIGYMFLIYVIYWIVEFVLFVLDMLFDLFL